MSDKRKNDGILLESGTNEVEIIEFYVRGQRFGVNVAKVKQIIPFDRSALSAMPKTPVAFRGVYLHRETTLPMIDLGDALHLAPLAEGEFSPLLLICNFNMQTIAFAIDGVNRIHRLSWSSFTPLNYFISESCDSIIGSVNIDQHEILVIDLERIVSEYDPETKAMYYGGGTDIEIKETVPDDICERHIFMAEDSTLIRSVLKRDMIKAGFKNVTMFANGQEALDAITALAHAHKDESLRGIIDVLVTDIEMPLLDGLTLCKRVKKELQLDIPVLIYSSLINTEIARKCQEVGADAFFSKPHIGSVVEAIRTNIKSITA